MHNMQTSTLGSCVSASLRATATARYLNQHVDMENFIVFIHWNTASAASTPESGSLGKTLPSPTGSSARASREELAA